LKTKHLFTKDIPYNKVAFRGQDSLQTMLNVIEPNIFPTIENNLQVGTFHNYLWV